MAKILITGTSKGIGTTLHLYLAKRGHEVVAGMRNPSNSDLGDVAAKDSLPIKIVTMDVDSLDSQTRQSQKRAKPDVLYQQCRHFELRHHRRRISRTHGSGHEY